MRRDQLRDGDKVRSGAMPKDAFVAQAPALLGEVQNRLYAEAKKLLESSIVTGIRSAGELAEYFGQGGEEDEASEFKGWARVPWSAPTGAALDKIEAALKALKISIRNAPMDQAAPSGKCIFTGEKAVQDILIARAY
jgi:prolyl-tRNA synthetase